MLGIIILFVIIFLYYHIKNNPYDSQSNGQSNSDKFRPGRASIGYHGHVGPRNRHNSHLYLPNNYYTAYEYPMYYDDEPTNQYLWHLGILNYPRIPKIDVVYDYVYPCSDCN